MATYRFSGKDVVANDDILENATGGTFVDVNGGTIPIYDSNDVPISTITSNAFGMSSVFKADVPSGYIKFGSVLNYVVADEVAPAAIAALGAVETANAALTQAGAALSAVQALIDGGGTGGLPAGTTLDAIPDGTARQAMTPTQAAKLAATPTTFLALGSTSSTAMVGSRVFTAIEVGAVATVSGAVRQWKPRPASAGYPTAAQGAQEGDVAELYEDA